MRYVKVPATYLDFKGRSGQSACLKRVKGAHHWQHIAFIDATSLGGAALSVLCAFVDCTQRLLV